ARYLGGTGTAHARPDPRRSFAGFLICAANAAFGRGIGRWGLGCMGVRAGGDLRLTLLHLLTPLLGAVLALFRF
ncbi:MAG: hypothetical protein RSC40_09355, partial [Clostridia bacterium]